MDHDVAGKEFGGESGNIGKLPLLEWNKSSQVGKGGTNSSKDSLKLPNDIDFEQGMEELLYYDTDDGASISGKEGDLETWFGVKEGVGPVDDGDVIPDEVVTEIMLEDQTRSIKRRRVMADKENEDDA
ncbi:hypothetical protein Tco_0180789 [Tanacetum coccineum]